MKRIAVALLLLAGCDTRHPVREHTDTAGDRLEAAAIARGLIVDGGRQTVTGLYARDGDRLCLAPGGGAWRVGLTVPYDERQHCEASGTARRHGHALDVTLARDCRFDATLDGDRIAFPAVLPAGCDRLCTGRASLSAFSAVLMSPAAAEAAALRGGGGKPLCGG